MEGKKSSAGEDNWSPNTIRSINQKIYPTSSINNNGPNFFHNHRIAQSPTIQFYYRQRFTGNTDTEVTIH